MCYTWFGAYPNHIHITIIAKKKTCWGIKKKEEKHNSTDRG
jgi:hypothetical protein